MMLEKNPELINQKNGENKTALIVTLQGLEEEEACHRILTLLLDNKAKINDRTAIDGPEEFHTPLHYAALRNSTALVELLLKNGADPTAKTKDNKLPAALVTKTLRYK